MTAVRTIIVVLLLGAGIGWVYAHPAEFIAAVIVEFVRQLLTASTPNDPNGQTPGQDPEDAAPG